jgi:hypothetical protein
MAVTSSAVATAAISTAQVSDAVIAATAAIDMPMINRQSK